MNIQSIKEKIKDTRVLLLGDVFLDRYIYGRIHRISPEAPVPVFLATNKTDYTLGGAANVAQNIRALGANVDLYGDLGCGENAAILVGKIKEHGIGGHLFHSEYQTMVKTRYICENNHHVLRVDEGEYPARKGIFNIPYSSKDYDVIVFSDYAKGFLNAANIGGFYAQYHKQGFVPIIIDPKPSNYNNYGICYLATPNLQEAREIMEIHYSNYENDMLNEREDKIMNCFRDSNVLVKKGDRGMTLYSDDDLSAQYGKDYPALADKVVSVSGAGDTVVAIMAVMIGAGFDLDCAAKMAQYGSAVAVEQRGTSVVSIDDIEDKMNRR